MNKKCLCTLRIEYQDGRHKSQRSIIHLKVSHLTSQLELCHSKNGSGDANEFWTIWTQSQCSRATRVS